MIGKLITRAIEWGTREYWKARGIEAIQAAQDHAVDMVQAVAREMRKDILTDAMRGEIERCVGVTMVEMLNAKTIDLQAAHADYVAKYGKHATYGDPSRPIVGVTSASRGYDYRSGLESHLSTKRVSE